MNSFEDEKIASRTWRYSVRSDTLCWICRQGINNKEVFVQFRMATPMVVQRKGQEIVCADERKCCTTCLFAKPTRLGGTTSSNTALNPANFVRQTSKRENFQKESFDCAEKLQRELQNKSCRVLVSKHACIIGKRQRQEEYLARIPHRHRRSSSDYLL